MSMSYSSSEIARISNSYKYFTQKIYMMAPVEVRKISSINFMFNYFK